MTAASEVPCRAGFADPHELAPARVSHLLEFFALLAIIAGDAVAFQQLLAVAMAKSPVLVTWTLIGALSAAATLSMHLAGKGIRRRKAGVHQAGRLWAWCLVFSWLGLGATALWFRLAAAGAHGSAGTGGVFGSDPAVGAATEIPLAALLLGLYLVGGVTAYGIGYTVHNPARGAYMRARREFRRALRAHRRATRRHQRALARRAWPVSGMLSQRVLAAVAPRPHHQMARATEVDSPSDDPFTGMAIDELAMREQAVTRARAQAAQLKEVARHRLASALAEPARTSGVFDGHAQAAGEAHSDLLQGAQ